VLRIRTILGAPLLTGAAAVWLWRRLRPEPLPWYDEPLPQEAATAALVDNDCLVTQLVCGDITGAQFRNAMERLAAADDERDPWSVPPAGH
jgi:hypothetical protein